MVRLPPALLTQSGLPVAPFTELRDVTRFTEWVSFLPLQGKLFPMLFPREKLLR